MAYCDPRRLLVVHVSLRTTTLSRYIMTYVRSYYVRTPLIFHCELVGKTRNSELPQ